MQFKPSPLKSTFAPSFLTLSLTQWIRPLYLCWSDSSICMRDLMTSMGVPNPQARTPAKPPESSTTRKPAGESEGRRALAPHSATAMSDLTTNFGNSHVFWEFFCAALAVVCFQWSQRIVARGILNTMWTRCGTAWEHSHPPQMDQIFIILGEMLFWWILPIQSFLKVDSCFLETNHN